MSESLQEREASADDFDAAAREANERIAGKAAVLRFTARVPFVCECGDPGCLEFVLLRPAEYGARRRAGEPVTAGHAPARGRLHAVDDA